MAVSSIALSVLFVFQYVMHCNLFAPTLCHYDKQNAQSAGLRLLIFLRFLSLNLS